MTGGNLLDADGVEICVTMELADRGNARDVSRIPAGTYVCNYRWSPSHNADKYHVDGVLNRDAIEIHTGNWPDQIRGCIALGTAFGKIEGRRGITLSQAAYDRFMAWAGGEDFELVITDPVPGAEP